MFKKMIAAALLAAAATLVGCGSELGSGASSEDAGNNNPETTIVANDAPVSQPDVPVVTVDAGIPPVDVTPPPEDVTPIVEDRPSVPADDGVVMMAAFSSEICRQLNDRCWRIQGTDEACDQIPCRMIAGGRARVIVPPSLLVQMGYPNATCSDRTCRLESIMSIPSDCYWVDLSETMSHFRCTCPGQPDINVESL